MRSQFPQFSRWTPAFPSSLALIVFRKHHSVLNHLYWAHEAARRGAYTLTRGKATSERAHSVFPNPTGRRRRSISLSEWSDDYNDFDNWTRLSAVVALTGYLEVYMKSVLEAGCQSCPGLLIGEPRAVDGLTLLKKRENYTFEDTLEKCVKGDWPSRFRAMESVFGRLPQGVKDYSDTLDDMRRLRNSVSHAFGRSLDYPVIGKHHIPSSVERVSEERLMKWLKVANTFAFEFDTHIVSSFVGNYELMCLYHFWAKGQLMHMRDDARLFGKHLGKIFPNCPGPRYRRALIAYYTAV